VSVRRADWTGAVLGRPEENRGCSAEMIKYRSGWLSMAIAVAFGCQIQSVSAGCGFPPSFSSRHQASNTGTIIVYRPRSIIGAAITTWRFNLNHGTDMRIGNGTYCPLTVLAGDSVISHDNVPFLQEDPQIVHVEPGQTVYFEYAAQLSLIFEVADDQERAARTVSQLVPMEGQVTTDESFTD